MLAIEFNLPDQDGNMHQLSNYREKWVIVYFYPKDGSVGCTKEACEFRDSFRILQAKDIIIMGISNDSVESHKQFAEENQLNFPILADTNAQTCIAYNAWKGVRIFGKNIGVPLRSSFLITPEGEVIKVYVKVDPVNHAKQILEDLEAYNLGVIDPKPQHS